MVPEVNEWSDARPTGGVALAAPSEEDFSNVPVPHLADVLGAIDFDVWMDTDDWSKAEMVADGFRHLIRMEFQRQQPLLARFYKLEFTKTSLERGGSRRYRGRIVPKLKDEHKETKEQLEKLRKDVENLKYATERMPQEIQETTSLKKQLRARLMALWLLMSPITGVLAGRALEEVFPSIQTVTVAELQNQHAPMPLTTTFAYPSPDYDRFPVDGFST